MLAGGGAHLQANKEDLVAVLPHNEGPQQADYGLGQVEHHLQQVVEHERARDGRAVAHLGIGKGTSNGVFRLQCAYAVLCYLPAHKAVGEGVVVALEGDDQDGDDQSHRTQEEVEELYNELHGGSLIRQVGDAVKDKSHYRHHTENDSGPVWCLPGQQRGADGGHEEGHGGCGDAQQQLQQGDEQWEAAAAAFVGILWPVWLLTSTGPPWTLL